MKLTLLRKKIDQIDHNLLKLLAGRLEICKEIGRYKKKNKLLIQNLAREKEIIKERNKRFEELGFNEIGRAHV